MSDQPIRIAILGLGFMGQTHFRTYREANESGHPCIVQAVCDSDAARRRGEILAVGNIDAGAKEERLFESGEIEVYSDPRELFADPSIDLVSICTHTDSHPDLCIAALEAGKHVIVEKPVALTAAEVARVNDAANSHPDQIIMPAMCMRFWPGWSWFKEQTEKKTYGAVRTATFHRLGSRPPWAPSFYQDFERSGGALVDLHIHDVDFIFHLFGRPSRVSSIGDLTHLTTLYHFDSDTLTHVVAEGGWGQVDTFPFQMRYLVNFEKATAEFDSRRGKHALHLYGADAERQTITLEEGTGYEFEIRHVLDLISGREATPRASIADALSVTRILEAERVSLHEARSTAVN